MMLNSKPFVAVLAALSLLSACANPAPRGGVQDRLTAPYVEAQHQLRFASGASAISDNERAALASFLRDLGLRDSDTLIATIPTSGTARIDAARLHHLQSLLLYVPAKKQYLLDESFGSRPTPARQVGILRVARARGIHVACQPGVEDLGCANAVNLAVMIHEPGDVLRPAATTYGAYK